MKRLFTSSTTSVPIAFSLLLVLITPLLFIFPLRYGEASDTFLIGHLMQKGFYSFEVFYWGIGYLLSGLYALFPSVPFNAIFLYIILFWAVQLVFKEYLKASKTSIITCFIFILALFFILFYRAFLFLDFTHVSILGCLSGSIILLLRIRNQECTKSYFSPGALLLITTLIRPSSSLFTILLLLPLFFYIGYSFEKSRIKLIALLSFFICVFILKNLIGNQNNYSSINKARVKLADYQISPEHITSNGTDITPIILLSHGISTGEPSIIRKVNKLSIISNVNITKARNQFNSFLSALVRYHIAIILFFLFMVISSKKDLIQKILYATYIIIICLLFCYYLKLPNRLLHPALFALLLATIFFRSNQETTFTKPILITLILVGLTTNIDIRMSNNKRAFQPEKIPKQNKNLLVQGLHKTTPYLSPLNNYEDTHLNDCYPIGGWIGILPKYQSIRSSINQYYFDNSYIQQLVEKSQ